ncbi:hypothetical protein B7463_g2927, partial [Scytalidium lignicola]
MASNTGATNNINNDASNNELVLYRAILFTGLKGKLEVDWNVVAANCSYKDGKTTSTRFSQFKKKFNETIGNKPIAGGANEDAGGDGESGIVTQTPTKGKAIIGKTTPKKIAKKAKKSPTKTTIDLQNTATAIDESMGASIEYSDECNAFDGDGDSYLA